MSCSVGADPCIRAAVLAKIDSTNIRNIPINTIYISHDNDESEGANFFRLIAQRNNGKFIVVDL